MIRSIGYSCLINECNVIILIDVMIIIVRYDFISIGNLNYEFWIGGLVCTRKKFSVCVCGWVGAGKLLHMNHRIRDRCEYRQVFGYYTEEEKNWKLC